jgi:hypothetical protein
VTFSRRIGNKSFSQSGNESLAGVVVARTPRTTPAPISKSGRGTGVSVRPRPDRADPKPNAHLKEQMKTFFKNLVEKAAYRIMRRLLLGYAKVFSTGLFVLEARQDRFESECKQVSDVFVRSILSLDSRLKSLENNEVR